MWRATATRVCAGVGDFPGIVEVHCSVGTGDRAGFVASGLSRCSTSLVVSASGLWGTRPDHHIRRRRDVHLSADAMATSSAREPSALRAMRTTTSREGEDVGVASLISGNACRQARRRRCGRRRNVQPSTTTCGPSLSRNDARECHSACARPWANEFVQQNHLRIQIGLREERPLSPRSVHSGKVLVILMLCEVLTRGSNLAGRQGFEPR
jgi:hypothetical protein